MGLAVGGGCGVEQGERGGEGPQLEQSVHSQLAEMQLQGLLWDAASARQLVRAGLHCVTHVSGMLWVEAGYMCITLPVQGTGSWLAEWRPGPGPTQHEPYRCDSACEATGCGTPRTLDGHCGGGRFGQLRAVQQIWWPLRWARQGCSSKLRSSRACT